MSVAGVHPVRFLISGSTVIISEKMRSNAMYRKFSTKTLNNGNAIISLINLHRINLIKLVWCIGKRGSKI